MAKKLISPLRYPGSKRRLVGRLENIIEDNQLTPELFIEPFAGGASVSLELLNKNIVEAIGLIELDPLVASFWKIVFYEPEWLKNKIKNTAITLEKWQDIKSNLPKYQNDKERAFACLFLNRTNFSGYMARNVGPIGGRSQNSDYKIDCRFPKETIIDRIDRISKLSDKVEFVWNLSWDEGLSKISGFQNNKELTKDILFYFDPPFYNQANKLYAFYFDDEDHKILRDRLITIKDSWILSYDYVDEIKQLYNGGGPNATHVEVLYNGSSLNGVKRAKELLVTNLEALPNN